MSEESSSEINSRDLGLGIGGPLLALAVLLGLAVFARNAKRKGFASITDPSNNESQAAINPMYDPQAKLDLLLKSAISDLRGEDVGNQVMAISRLAPAYRRNLAINGITQLSGQQAHDYFATKVLSQVNFYFPDSETAQEFKDDNDALARLFALTCVVHIRNNPRSESPSAINESLTLSSLITGERQSDGTTIVTGLDNGRINAQYETDKNSSIDLSQIDRTSPIAETNIDNAAALLLDRESTSSDDTIPALDDFESAIQRLADIDAAKTATKAGTGGDIDQLTPHTNDVGSAVVADQGTTSRSSIGVRRNQPDAPDVEDYSREGHLFLPTNVARRSAKDYSSMEFNAAMQALDTDDDQETSRLLRGNSGQYLDVNGRPTLAPPGSPIIDPDSETLPPSDLVTLAEESNADPEAARASNFTLGGGDGLAEDSTTDVQHSSTPTPKKQGGRTLPTTSNKNSEDPITPQTIKQALIASADQVRMDIASATKAATPDEAGGITETRFGHTVAPPPTFNLDDASNIEATAMATAQETQPSLLVDSSETGLPTLDGLTTTNLNISGGSDRSSAPNSRRGGDDGRARGFMNADGSNPDHSSRYAPPNDWLSPRSPAQNPQSSKSTRREGPNTAWGSGNNPTANPEESKTHTEGRRGRRGRKVGLAQAQKETLDFTRLDSPKAATRAEQSTEEEYAYLPGSARRGSTKETGPSSKQLPRPDSFIIPTENTGTPSAAPKPARQGLRREEPLNLGATSAKSSQL